ncbi:urea active transporter-like protein [Hortaea werneckii]|uniref:Urea active transporter n=1 Tax=Hortaea werneckii TaxID=91943 RepID=A0A3M7ALW3_HORWE|nr:urea active transporter-like protein [Hortaea werneckii]RMY28554.1 hypothetical protein D0866_09332 [Hortaea werneckii]
MSSVAPVLPVGVGYGLTVAIGFLFAIFMVGITWSLKRYTYEAQTSEQFTTAGRTVKSGLVASSVVSTWTWAATLLQSTTVTYQYGVSGAFWYAGGACVQIILFATLAIELKRRAPKAHTFLEVVRARYGPVTHGVFMVFGCFTNILVTAMLLTGGAAVVEFLTGAPTVATVFLFPIGVVIYTLYGGIKAIFITDYINTLVFLIVIFSFAFTTYTTNSVLGSPGRLWEILTNLAHERPLEGNAGGSYLTMKSHGGGVFFVINLIGNFGTVFLDNSYYNKAIAASPVHALPGYAMGGLAWFAVPWVTATCMGLAGLALEGYEVWPTYPNRLSDVDVTAGLVLPNTAVALLGKGGAVGALFLAYMAIMSTYSSELISVSSISAYDIYQTYINPRASRKQLMRVNYLSMTGFALFMAGFSTMLYYVGVGMGYLYLLMGVIISSAVLPATLTLIWSGMSWQAATFAPPLGFCSSMIAWLVTTHATFGEFSVATTGSNTPMLVGNVVALLSPLIYIPILTYMPPFKPQNYDWVSMANISSQEHSDNDRDQESGDTMGSSLQYTPSVTEREAERKKLDRAAKIARILCVSLALCFIILWPMPMFGSGYIFSKSFYTGWVVVGIIWLFCSSGVVVFLPLWQSRETIAHTFRSVGRDVAGKGRPVWRPETMEGQGVEVQTTTTTPESEKGTAEK